MLEIHRIFQIPSYRLSLPRHLLGRGWECKIQDGLSDHKKLPRNNRCTDPAARYFHLLADLCTFVLAHAATLLPGLLSRHQRFRKARYRHQFQGCAMACFSIEWKYA